MGDLGTLSVGEGKGINAIYEEYRTEGRLAFITFHPLSMTKDFIHVKTLYRDTDN
jgi:hypothetical protein